MCYRPITIKNGSVVPCGKCAKCVARRISAWSFRLMEEEKVSSSANFITLTYDTKYAPITENGYMSISKRDVQLFFKRLRKSHKGNKPIKYYTVGEYGGKTLRPHYHSILFNANIELINDAWEMGNIHYGDVTGASIGYCLKYMCKPSKYKKWCKHNGLQTEFSLMSKGLGVSYLCNDQMYHWHHGDPVERNFLTVDGKKKISMPRYYKDKLYDMQERANIRDAGLILASEKWNEKYDKQTFREFVNNQKAIDHSYDILHKSSLKTVI